MGDSVFTVNTQEEFLRKLQEAGDKLVVVEFFAEWCGPCKMFGPQYEAQARTHPEVMFLRIDVDVNREVAVMYNVRSMPTVIFLKRSEKLDQFSGADVAQLTAKIDQHKDHEAIRWFVGDINQAIEHARRMNRVFVVYIRGNNEDSRMMDELLASPLVSNVLEFETVPVRLQADSQLSRQFSMFYPVLLVPSLFVLRANGEVSDVMTARDSTYTVAQKLRRACGLSDLPPEDDHQCQPSTSRQADEIDQDGTLTERRPTPPSVTMDDASTSSHDNALSGKLSSNTHTHDAENAQLQHIDDDGGDGNDDENRVMERSVSPTPNPNNPSSNGVDKEDAPTLEEKVKRAQDLAKEIRMRKLAEEEAEERRKEHERRSMEKAMRLVEQRRQEEQLKERAAEFRKNREEQRAHRQQLLQQIEQDKKNRQAAEAERRNVAAPSVAPPSSQEPPTGGDINSPETRIMFRVSDGRAEKHVFPSTSTIADVHQFVSDNIVNNANFVLSLNFPRRDFSLTAEGDRTLRQLQLVPSGVFHVRLVNYSAMNLVPSWGMRDFIVSLMHPLIMLYDFVTSFFMGIFGTGGATPQPAHEGGPGLENLYGATPDSDTQNRPGPSNGPPGSGVVRRRGANRGAGGVVRRDGNIHRFTTGGRESSDDDDGTWNGNSTQQY